jgi:hypothetical protein
MPIIQPTWESEMGKIMASGWYQAKKACELLSQQNKAGMVVQPVISATAGSLK